MNYYKIFYESAAAFTIGASCTGIVLAISAPYEGINPFLAGCLGLLALLFAFPPRKN